MTARASHKKKQRRPGRTGSRVVGDDMLAMRIAFPMLGDSIKMPVISAQGPTLSFVSYDIFDLTPNVNGNMGVIILPNFVDVRTGNINNVTQQLGFWTKPTLLPSGDFDFSGTAGTTTVGTGDAWLTGNFAGPTPAASKFIRARINSVSVEGFYTGAPLYAQGITTIQIFDPQSTNVNGSIVAPALKTSLCNSYRTFATKEGFIFSLPCTDRATAVLAAPGSTSAGTSGFLGSTATGGGWPGVAIRMIGCTDSATSIYRIVVKRLIDVELAPVNSIMSSMMTPHPVQNSSRVYSRIDNLVADNELKLHAVPTESDPEETIWNKLSNPETYYAAGRAVGAAISAAPHAYRLARSFHRGMRGGRETEYFMLGDEL